MPASNVGLWLKGAYQWLLGRIERNLSGHTVMILLSCMISAVGWYGAVLFTWLIQTVGSLTACASAAVVCGVWLATSRRIHGA